MKKLIIVVAALTIGIVAQAANVNWTTGALYLPNPDGSWSSTQATSSTAGNWSIVVSFFDSTQAPFAAGGTLSDNSITDLTHALNGGASGFENGKNYYMSAILTYTTDDYTFTKEFDKVAFTTKTSGASTANMQATALLTTKMIDTSAPLGWTITSNVPEPTSGLLMLLGIAGLALRRRRA